MMRADLARFGALVDLDEHWAGTTDTGKFLLAGKPARVIPRFSGWFTQLGADWFEGVPVDLGARHRARVAVVAVLSHGIPVAIRVHGLGRLSRRVRARIQRTIEVAAREQGEHAQGDRPEHEQHRERKRQTHEGFSSNTA